MQSNTKQNLEAASVDSKRVNTRADMTDSFDYKGNADLCDALREMLKGFASIGGINSVDAYNLALAGAEVQRRFNQKTQSRLEKSLIECRDILCALMTSDGAIKLAYLSATDIPAAIRNGYDALQMNKEQSLTG